MSRDTGFDGRDIEWHNKGFNKDIDFDKSKESRDKNITKEPNCGSPMGFISSLTIILHIVFCYIFSFEYIMNLFKNNEIMGLFIKYLPAIVTIAITVYISNLSKYAVG